MKEFLTKIRKHFWKTREECVIEFYEREMERNHKHTKNLLSIYYKLVLTVAEEKIPYEFTEVTITDLPIATTNPETTQALKSKEEKKKGYKTILYYYKKPVEEHYQMCHSADWHTDYIIKKWKRIDKEEYEILQRTPYQYLTSGYDCNFEDYQ